ncbi:ABC transporter substrate-binding protein [Herbiconiux sp. SYSU D00978]|uniref:ABC transporter substrate-binding protein n=1 Tax=Herbiconiux sp. SYSU D00978 TaxID=2812562 RepID=UPI001A9688CF|nr:ABC transporter substrate-binding protein [Herbiconiux sp. SYSU D00978]
MHRTSLRSAAALSASAVALLALTACAPSNDTSAASSSGDDSGTVSPGVLTIATGEPAYYPWVLDDAPESGEGFEAAVAYAVAEELGYSEDEVEWVRTTFDAAIAPGPKDFDFNLQQFSITDERREFVDFSSPYYTTTQAVITTEDSAAADASSLADLKDFRIGAQTGTTSFTAIEQIIQPNEAPAVYNDNDAAKLALQSGEIDALVVDLPTAFYLTGVEIDGGVILGQLPPAEGTEGDSFGLVLAKDSPLTEDVTAAVDALREDGTLNALAEEWLAEATETPVLQ